MDHFVPWSFTLSNSMWNLLPIDSNINSSKSNNLPSVDFLKPFSKLQRKALTFWYNSNFDDKDKKNIMEDYLTIHDSVPELVNMSEDKFYDVFRKTISPMLQIAENSGFKIWQQ